MRADALTPALSHREREKSSARCNNAHRSVPSPLRERVRVRGNMRADALTPALSHREREKSSARCYNAHRSVPSPLRERARVRG
ncbi:hypothetical protein ACVZZ9_004591, partial [Escherichia coli]